MKGILRFLRDLWRAYDNLAKYAAVRILTAPDLHVHMGHDIDGEGAMRCGECLTDWPCDAYAKASADLAAATPKGWRRA